MASDQQVIVNKKQIHYYAYDSKGNIHCAKDCNYIDKRKYQCLERAHSVKLVKCRSRENKRKFRDYFAHIVKKQKGRSNYCSCCEYSDSLQIQNAKLKLAEATMEISFPVKKCVNCDMEVHVISDFKRYKIKVNPIKVFVNQKWKYDCCLIDTLKENKVKAVIEVVDSSYTSIPKLIEANDNGVYIIEIAVEDLDILDGAYDTPIVVKNLHVIKVLCSTCIMHEFAEARMAELNHDIEKWKEYENLIYKSRLLESALSLDGVDSNDQAVAILVEVEYMKILNKLLNDPIVKFSKQFPLHKDQFHHGIIANCSTVLNQSFYIAIIDTTPSPVQLEQIMRKAKQGFSIEREFVIILTSQYIVKNKHKFMQAKLSAQIFEIKDIKWAVCMEMQRTLNVCANCGKRGHQHNVCRRKICVRCRRFNHYATECFARTFADGRPFIYSKVSYSGYLSGKSDSCGDCFSAYEML